MHAPWVSMDKSPLVYAHSATYSFLREQGNVCESHESSRKNKIEIKNEVSMLSALTVDQNFSCL